MSPPELPGHVALVVNDLQPYGAQRVALAVAEQIAALGVRTDLITIEDPARDGLEPSGALERLSVVRRGGGAAGYAGVVASLARLLNRRDPDLVIGHMVFANVVTLAAAALLPHRRLPVLVTEHSVPTVALSIERSPRALAELTRRLYPRARRVVCVSEAVREDLTRNFGIAREHTVKVFNPVDVEAVRAAGRVDPPHPWLVADGGPPTVVCAASFRAPKGHDVLLRALALAPRVRAILLGDGALEADMRELAHELALEDRVVFAGFREDVSAFVVHASALVIPSRWEGFGLVAVEAAALGVPVLACSIPAMVELIPTHVPGRLVAPEDPGALAAGLAELAGGWTPQGDPHLEDFDPERVARAYLDAAALPAGS